MLIPFIGGAAIGALSDALGYGITTWQYWAFAIPASALWGYSYAVLNARRKV